MRGKKVTLRPMKKDEKGMFYRWAVDSDGTPFWYGELYGDRVPTKGQFFRYYKEHYFSDSKPELGRCFTILLHGEAIGQINHNRITDGVTELDILIPDSRHWGKGYGSDAIGALMTHLKTKMGVKTVWIAGHRKNRHALRAYERAGMSIIKHPPPYIKVMKKGTMKKSDWVVLVSGSIIRKATEKDIPQLKKLWDQLMAYHKKFGYGSGLVEYKKNKDELYMEFIGKQLKRRNAAVFVAEKDGKIVGHVMVEISKAPPIYVHDRYAHIGEIVVDPKHRRKGIGKALLEEAEAWAKKKKMTSIALTVHVKNKNAHSAYRKSGFEDFNMKMVKIVK